MRRTVHLSFSIVTPTLNRASMLRQAIDSVRLQDWSAVEHIVADGGSSDGTLALLQGAPSVRVLNGPDLGIYDGLNKALAQAGGDVVGWLNSDDLYRPGAFAAVARTFSADPGLAAVCGGAEIVTNGVVERRYQANLVADLSPGALLIGPTLPNAWFFRRSVLESVGGFSREFRYAADSDFMQRFAKLRLPHAATPAVLYCYRRHPGSATLRDDGVPYDVRVDMLQLAYRWRDDGDSDVRAAARALEGRCRVALGAEALQRGDLREVMAHIVHAPTLARGLFDYAARRLVPRLRRRRLGERISPS